MIRVIEAHLRSSGNLRNHRPYRYKSLIINCALLNYSPHPRSRVFSSPYFLVMAYHQQAKPVIGGLLALELIFVIVAFGLAIATDSKEQGLSDQLQAINAGATVGDLITKFNIFTVSFGFFTITMLTILWHIDIIPGEFFLLIQFLNFAFFIASFIQFATYNTGDIGCDSLTGDLHTAFCSLPKACEGINCVVWILALACFSIRHWTVGKEKATQNVEMSENPAPVKQGV